MGPKCRSLCLAAGLLLGVCVSAADPLNDVESLLQQHLVQEPTPDSEKAAPQEAATQPESAPAESAPTSPEEEPETLEPFDEIGPIGEEVNTTQTTQTQTQPSAGDRISSIFWDMLFNPMSVPAIKGKAARYKAVDGDYVIDMSVDEYLADQARALADQGLKEAFKYGLKQGKAMQKVAGHVIKHKVLDQNKGRKALSKKMKKSIMQELQKEKIKTIKRFTSGSAGARTGDVQRKEKIRKLVDNTLKPLDSSRMPPKVLTSAEKRRHDHKAKVDEWARIESEQRQEKRRIDAIHHAKIEHDQAEKELLHPNIWPDKQKAPGSGGEPGMEAVDDGVKEEEDALKKAQAPNPPTEQPPSQ